MFAGEMQRLNDHGRCVDRFCSTALCWLTTLSWKTLESTRALSTAPLDLRCWPPRSPLSLVSTVVSTSAALFVQQYKQKEKRTTSSVIGARSRLYVLDLFLWFLSSVKRYKIKQFTRTCCYPFFSIKIQALARPMWNWNLLLGVRLMFFMSLSFDGSFFHVQQNARHRPHSPQSFHYSDLLRFETAEL